MTKYKFSVWYYCIIFFITQLVFSLYEPVQAQSPSCSNALSRAISHQKDGIFPIYKFQDQAGFVIGIAKEDIGTNYILSTYIERGISSSAGYYVQSSIVKFELEASRIRMIETLANITYAEGSPLERTRETSLSDSRLLSLSILPCSDDKYIFGIVNENSLISFATPAIQRFGSQVGQISRSGIDASVSSVKTYKDNVSFSVDLNLNASRIVPGAANFTNFNTRISHSILRLPDDNYIPRIADPSIGYFIVNRLDLSNLNPLEENQFIQRWRLEKEYPDEPLSKPVKPITFWIENTTPYDFRDYIRQGVLAWNEAFEAAGFSDAIEVKIQPDDAEWDAGDINYNVIRWEASPYNVSRIGLGPSTIDPRTGEILAADVLLNFTGLAQNYGPWLSLSDYKWADQPQIGDQVAAFNAQPQTPIFRISRQSLTKEEKKEDNQLTEQESYNPNLSNKIIAPNFSRKPTKDDFSNLISLASLIAEARTTTIPEGRDNQKIRSLTPGNEEEKLQQQISANAEDDFSFNAGSLSERMIKEIVINLTMHEVGHTLGLFHNFSGTHYRSNDVIHNRDITQGVISASVMDYTPINFAPPGKPQGDFTNTRLGPYDIWSIIFGYDESLDKDNIRRQELLRKAGTPGYQLGLLLNDPRTLTFDLSDDPSAYAVDRIKLVTKLMENSDSWSRNKNTSVNFRLYGEIVNLRMQALSMIMAQLSPVRLDVDDSFERPDRNRIVKSFTTAADQEKAIRALGAALFSIDDWSVPPGLNKRLGVFSLSSVSSDGGRKLVTDATISSLLNIYALSTLDESIEQGGEGLSSGEYLQKLRQVIFGADLSPSGNPSDTRQFQQNLYVRRLLELHYQAEYAEFDDVVFGLQLHPVRQSIKKEIEILKRELQFPYFWLSKDTKKHRETLREMLN